METKTPNIKTVQQFRAETLNVNGVECTFTGGNFEELKQTIQRIFTGTELEFTAGDERGIAIFQRGDGSNPVGWIETYYVPEHMSVNPGLQKVA